MPILRAVSTIFARPARGPPFPPIAIDSLTGTTLMERVIACVSVTEPEYERP